MKKIITALLAVVLLSAMLIPASAATEEELVEEFKKIPISRYLITEVENLAANYDVTEEQGDLLMELVEQAKEAFPEDKGPGYANPEGHESYFGEEKYPYTEEQLDTAMAIIAEARDILGFTYEFVNSEKPMHDGDISIILRDSEGRIALRYDGDIIKPLGEVEDEQSSAPYLVGGISVITLAGIAFATLKLRKKEQA